MQKYLIPKLMFDPLCTNIFVGALAPAQGDLRSKNYLRKKAYGVYFMPKIFNTRFSEVPTFGGSPRPPGVASDQIVL